MSCLQNFSIWIVSNWIFYHFSIWIVSEYLDSLHSDLDILFVLFILKNTYFRQGISLRRSCGHFRPRWTTTNSRCCGAMRPHPARQRGSSQAAGMNCV
jgi:hypothetical protein